MSGASISPIELIDPVLYRSRQEFDPPGGTL